MYLFLKRLPFLLAVIAFLASCRKGEMPEEHYFGKVDVTLLNLPNTPKIMMYFDGKQLDTIRAVGDGSHFFLPAGQKGKLSAYDAGKHELLADTMITIAPNSKQQFRFAYSPELGLKGFVGAGGGSSVPVDSFDVQLFNSLTASFYPLEKYDLAFIFADPDSGEILDYPLVLKGWSRGKLSAVLRLRAVNANGHDYTYAAKLIDPATGEVVLQPDGSEFFTFGSDKLGGKTEIVSVVNDPTGGYISTSYIDL